MPFIEYPKVHRLGKEETEGILIGKCTIQEKVDGANTSIWLDEGQIQCGSRTQNVSQGSFNGFVEFAKAHEGINKLLNENPHLYLYGEWLVRHTISYKETSYKQFYLFDIFDTKQEKFLSNETVKSMADQYGVTRVQEFGVLINPTLEQIMPFVGTSILGPKGEGVVIKNEEFVNKFGEKRYAKIVTEKFKEDNAIVFGGNNKHSDTYWEMYVVNKYITVARVEKIINKIQPTIDHPIGKEDTARVIHTVYHDMITEEVWDIVKHVPELNFKKLSVLCTRKAAMMFKDILENNMSVAYK